MNDVIWVDGTPYFWPYYDITLKQIRTLIYQHGNIAIDSIIVQKLNGRDRVIGESEAIVVDEYNRFEVKYDGA